MSESLIDIKARILKLDSQLHNAGDAPNPAPEMLDATNALRLCEHFAEIDSIKSELIGTYVQYSAGLEEMVGEALQIQKDLSALLSKKSKRPVKKPQRETTAKRKPPLRKITIRKKPSKKKPQKKTLAKRKTLKRKPSLRKITIRKKLSKKKPQKKTTRRKSSTKHKSSRR